MATSRNAEQIVRHMNSNEAFELIEFLANAERAKLDIPAFLDEILIAVVQKMRDLRAQAGPLRPGP